MPQSPNEVRMWNRLLAQGVPLLAIYLEHGAWQTGRIQRVRCYNALVWYVQPWGVAEWREVQTYRSIWRDCLQDVDDANEKGVADVK